MCAGYMLVILLQEKGFTNTTIGIVLSVNSIISIIVQPFLGMLTDYLKSIKKVFILCITCTTLLLSSLYFINSSVAIIILIFIDIVFRCSLVTLLDNWVVTKANEYRKLDYGRIRVAGSITYSLVSYLYGVVISKYSASAILPINLLLGCITICIAFFTPDQFSLQKQKKTNIPDINPQTIFKSLLCNKKYLAIIFLVTFNSLAISSLMSFLPNFLINVGGSTSQSAYAQAIKAISEIPFFIFSGTILVKLSLIRSIKLSSLLNFCALIIIYFASSPMQIMVSFVVIGFSYSLLLTAKLRYILAIVPQNIATTAFTLVSAFEYGLASSISNLFGGYILDRFPVKVLNICAILAVLVGVMIFFVMSKSSDVYLEKDLNST
jgi:PPP family 3-phenylpropionic acid transporter